MDLYNELSSDEKYALTRTISGLVDFINRSKYHNNDTDVITTLIRLAYEEYNYININDIINELKSWDN